MGCPSLVSFVWTIGYWFLTFVNKHQSVPIKEESNGLITSEGNKS